MMLERFLQDIEVLVNRSKNIEDIDVHVEEAVLEHRRNHLLRSLQENVELVIQSGKSTMGTFGLPENKVLVNSAYRSWFRGGKHREGYLPTTVHSNPGWWKIKSNIEILRAYDREENRALFLDEFIARSQILFEAVEKGELDKLFGTPPFEILHMIIGRHGELLPDLNIDPMNSRMYRVGTYDIIEKMNGEPPDSGDRIHSA
jgi:hypothetical protein